MSIAAAHCEDARPEAAAQKKIRKAIFVEIASSDTRVLTALAKTDILCDVGKCTIAHVAEERWGVLAAIQYE
jgi:hypothetical protein